MQKQVSVLLMALLCLAACRPLPVSEGPTPKLPSWAIASEGPRVALLLSGPGLSIVTSEGQPMRHSALRGSQPAFVAKGIDGLGLSEVFVEVLEGGHLIGPDKAAQQRLAAAASPAALAAENEQLALEGRIAFDASGKPLRLRAGARNLAGETAFTAILEVRPLAPPTARLRADRSRVQPGEAVTLAFEAEHADLILLNGKALHSPMGSLEVHPTRHTRYILETLSKVGRARAEVHVQVESLAAKTDHNPAEGLSADAGGRPWTAGDIRSQADSQRANAELFSYPTELGSGNKCHSFYSDGGGMGKTGRLGAFEEWALDLREGCMRDKISRVTNRSAYRLNVSVGTFSETLEPGETTHAFEGADFGAYYLVVAAAAIAEGPLQLEICTE